MLKGDHLVIKTTIINKDNIWLITGVWVPDSGSIKPAKLKPVLAAIFSPAKLEAENKTVKDSAC